MPAWQSENERFTTARTVTDGFSVAAKEMALFVLHKANEPSGGKLVRTELGDFLRKANAGPEHQALRHMIGTLLDE